MVTFRKLRVKWTSELAPVNPCGEVDLGIDVNKLAESLIADLARLKKKTKEQ